MSKPIVKISHDCSENVYYHRYERMIDITILISCIITLVGILFIHRFPAEFSGQLGRIKRFLVLTPLLSGATGFFIVSVEKVVKISTFRKHNNFKPQPLKTPGPPPYSPGQDNHSFNFKKK